MWTFNFQNHESLLVLTMIEYIAANFLKIQETYLKFGIKKILRTFYARGKLL